MDVELSDGKCFEIFRQTDIRCPVIITTAYADYALDAFKVKCIDYLMKPIESGAFRESVERCLQLCGVTAAKKDKPDITAYAKPTYKHHYTIKLGSQILAIDTRDIAYFHSNDKSTYLVTRSGKEYMTDESLVMIGDELDPSVFYKISRKCIISMDSIYTISKYFNSRLSGLHTAGEEHLVLTADIPESHTVGIPGLMLGIEIVGDRDETAVSTNGYPELVLRIDDIVLHRVLYHHLQGARYDPGLIVFPGNIYVRHEC